MSKSTIKRLFFLNTAIAGGLTFINHCIFLKAEKGILRSDKGRYYDNRFGKIYYEVSGRGEDPLLLIHNSSYSDSSFEWFHVSRELNKKYKIFTIDLPGCGRSEKQPIQYTNYLMVLMINDFIRNVIGEPVHICATGLSGSFAVIAAQVDPSLFKKITMINPVSLKSLKSGLVENAKALRFLLCLPVIGTTIYNIVSNRSNMDYRLKEEYFFNPFLVQQSTMDALYESSHKDNGKGRYFLASLNGGYLSWDISKAFASLKLPITILYGEKTESGSENADSYAKLNSNVSIFEIPKTKWIPQLEDPKSVASYL